MNSFVPVSPDSDFSIHNLPYGVFKLKIGSEPAVCTAIGDYIVDLSVLEHKGLFLKTDLKDNIVFAKSSLNGLMAAGRKTWKQIRTILQTILSGDNPILRDDSALRKIALIPMTDVIMELPVKIGDYTDFYSSKEHATNVGTMFRGKENALMPNWVYMPIAYHGRSSSLIVSGTDVIRPMGQIKSPNAELPSFSPTRMLDFELETGFFIGIPGKLGERIPADDAYNHIFGMVLVNDWSARDIQTWEYQPLGPFLAKNFATSVSPWVVTMEALEPFKCPVPLQNPAPIEYLKAKDNFSFDIKLEVSLQTEHQKERFVISKSNFKYLYWSMFQQLAHHTVNGCNVRTGDLMASGTISGSEKNSFGSMLELTWKGENPIKLPSGEERKFLEDGDTVTIKGYCKGEYRIGFGEVSGKIMPARTA